MLTTVKRGLAAAALLILPLTAAPAPAAADTAPAVVAPMTLTDGINLLPVAEEVREGYKRTLFKHWVDADRDGCNTRMEVLIEESRTKPTIEAGCKVTAGTWYSYYDGLTFNDPSKLDIDHMVPLAEAWDSGAFMWKPERREAYANDLNSPRSLLAVSAKTNRSKADQDPTTWLPPLADARCTYIADWVSTKLRWQLSVDQAEQTALTRIAGGCGQETVDYTPAP
ncbi:HNH endonuclease family protein [Streptomyces sp. 35G-GA-8]|uniref:HNH endonuclease family protein n=1 Tax=Streptomyces sp. 35G-GA-8 TaxID=2939434 RepID=UPI00201ED9DA|nr:HNH endonuclease family protein [Streptomyces sp. 35G-GA-8]MCL7377449.1 HNH endonuclease family protein [Streptomyces sp. 35G-GA-8]